MTDKISFEDVEEYQHLFTLVPSFVLERMAKKNSNLVEKFKSSIQSHIDALTDGQRKKLNVILDSDIDDLQGIMDEAYNRTNKKQFKILADPKYRDFIEKNLDELKKLI